jgi:hypothetical protein
VIEVHPEEAVEVHREVIEVHPEEAEVQEVTINQKK